MPPRRLAPAPGGRGVPLDLDVARAQRFLEMGRGFPGEERDPQLATASAHVAQILRIASAVSRELSRLDGVPSQERAGLPSRIATQLDLIQGHASQARPLILNMRNERD
jgi:hypothetical protein